MVVLTSGTTLTEDVYYSSEFPNGIKKSDYNKIQEIHAEAERKYAIVKGDCRLTKSLKRAAKADYIKKLMVKYGYGANQTT